MTTSRPIPFASPAETRSVVRPLAMRLPVILTVGAAVSSASAFAGSSSSETGASCSGGSAGSGSAPAYDPTSPPTNRIRDQSFTPASLVTAPSPFTSTERVEGLTELLQSQSIGGLMSTTHRQRPDGQRK